MAGSKENRHGLRRPTAQNSVRTVSGSIVTPLNVVAPMNGLSDGDGVVCGGGGVRVGREVPGPTIDIQAENGAKEIAVDDPAVAILVAAAPFVAQGHVEVTIGPEMDIAAVVIAGLVVLRDEREFGIG